MMERWSRRGIVGSFVVAAAAVVAGCDSGDAELEADALDGRDGSAAEGDDDIAASGPVTWNDHVGPLLGGACGSCHVEDGAGQFDLTTFESASRFAPVAVAAMQEGRMPPWPPSDDCRTYEHARRLEPGSAALVQRWMDAGMPVGEGEARRFGPQEEAGLRADLAARMETPYIPDAALDDDYRCFVLDLEFNEDTWVEGAAVRPGSPQVHHVLLFALNGTGLEQALAADAADELPGYLCFGGPVPSRSGSGSGMLDPSSGLATQVGAWVPGLSARPLPSEAAMRIEAGSRLVMQVHYNTLAGTGEPDQTSVALQTRSTSPAFVWRTVPIAQRTLDIAAGDPASVQSVTIAHRGSRPLTIASATAHMHTLGSRIEAHVERAGADEDACLLAIDSWDFDWQMQYFFHPAEYVTVQPGDSVTLQCVYDNSPANQPIVDGAPIDPRDVSWGEGTLDEMCLLYLGTITPFEDAVPPVAAADACAPAAGCFDACEEPTATCLMNCPEVTTTCIGCAVQGLVRCGASGCGPGLLAARECLVRCGLSELVFGASYGECMRVECPETWASVTACLDPWPAEEACAPAMEACGL